VDDLQNQIGFENGFGSKFKGCKTTTTIGDKTVSELVALI
jgi:guanylate kinase